MTTPEQSDVLHGLKALKATKYGKQFQKDTWDLLCSLALVLRPRSVKQRPFGKSFPDSFTGNEALSNLASLTFIRSPDTSNLMDIVPQSIVTLKLSTNDAKVLMQNFMEARLIKDATSNEYAPPIKKKALYQFTFKGLLTITHLLQANDIAADADHLASALSTLPMPRPNLGRHLERRVTEDDSLVISKSIVANLFHHFAGNTPNYGLGNECGVLLVNFLTRNKLLQDVKFVEGEGALDGKVTALTTTHCFDVAEMINWMCTCTSINSHAEAVEMGAHFVRFGLITLIKENLPKKIDPSKTIVVTGPTSASNPFVAEEGQFLYLMTAIYAITDEGRRMAGWMVPKPHVHIERNASTSNYTAHLALQRSKAQFSQPFDENSTNAIRLRTLLKEPAMRSQFREFLSQKNYEYNVSFWLDVEDFRTELEQAAKPSPSPRPHIPDVPVASSSRTPMESVEPPPEARQHEVLSDIPFMIYNTYLAPESTCGLRFEIGELATELQSCLDEILDYMTKKALIASVEPGYESSALDIGQLQVLLELYGRIQSRVFRIMAVRYVPRFIKSPQFLATRFSAIADEPSRTTESEPAAANLETTPLITL